MDVEALLYLKVWVLSIFYALVQFNQSCNEKLYSLSPEDFAKGWTILHRMKDNSDMEWNVMTTSFQKYWPMLLFQILCSHLLFKVYIHAVPLFYSCYSILCLAAIVGLPGVISYLTVVLIMYLAHKSGRKYICYIVTMCILPLLHNTYFLKIKDSIINDEIQSFLFDVGLAWLVAKSLSFSIDNITSGSYRKNFFKDIPYAISYCFYLPTMFTGPILTYEKFNSNIYMKPPLVNIKKGLLRLLYVFLWYFVYEFCLHFIYSSAIQYYPDIVSNFEGWAFCGLGYALPMMFYLKYFIVYSVASCIAQLEGFYFPSPPKCISATHTSSFLWRNFDEGLYVWIKKYLYFPILGSKWTVVRKGFGVAVCFAFVCLWHGMDKAVTTWCVMNFFLVSSEHVLEPMLSGRQRKSRLHTRMVALFSTPHFLMMCLSCTFFLSNWDIGVMFLKRVLLGGKAPLIPLLCVMYCGCHVSMFFKKYQKNTITAF